MEFSDILIFILAAIGITISAVSKNAKKKAEEARRLTRPDVGEWDEKEYHIPESEEIIDSYDNDSPPPVDTKSYWSYDDETIKANVSSPQINDMNRKSQKLKDERLKINEAFDLPVDQTTSENSGKSSHKHFNLRDAIIYSELLKPKHEEY